MIRVLLLISITASCRGIRWNPDFYVGDYEVQGIRSERGELVYSNEIRFNEFGCLHKTKIKELSEILRRARMPRKTKQLLFMELKKIDRALP